MKPKRSARIWESAANERQRGPRSVSESTDARTTGRCSGIEGHWFCFDLEEAPIRCTDCISRAFQSFKFVFDVKSSHKFGIERPCGIYFGSRLVYETEWDSYFTR